MDEMTENRLFKLENQGFTCDLLVYVVYFNTMNDRRGGPSGETEKILLKKEGRIMKLSAFQFSVTGNVGENLKIIKAAAVRAAGEGVRLLAFPECALTGYPPRNIPSSAAVDFGRLETAYGELQDLADKLGINLILGTVTQSAQRIRNTALILRPGLPPLMYHKRALWGWDRDNFVPGNEMGVVEIDGVRVGVRICFEVRFPEFFRELYQQHTDLNVILFYDVTDGDKNSRYDLLRGHIRTRAVENVCYTLSVNTSGPSQSAPTMLVNRSGAVLAEAERDREELLLFDLTPYPRNWGYRALYLYF